MKTIIITLVMLSFSLVCEASIMPIEVNDFEVQETMLPEIKTDWTKNISCITEERTDYITRLRQIFWYSKLFAIFHVKISNPIDYPIPFPMGSMALNSSIPVPQCETPIPPSLILVFSGLGVMYLVRRRRATK